MMTRDKNECTAEYTQTVNPAASWRYSLVMPTQQFRVILVTCCRYE